MLKEILLENPKTTCQICYIHEAINEADKVYPYVRVCQCSYPICQECLSSLKRCVHNCGVADLHPVIPNEMHNRDNQGRQILTFLVIPTIYIIVIFAIVMSSHVNNVYTTCFYAFVIPRTVGCDILYFCLANYYVKKVLKFILYLLHLLGILYLSILVGLSFTNLWPEDSSFDYIKWLLSLAEIGIFINIDQAFSCHIIT